MHKIFILFLASLCFIFSFLFVLGTKRRFQKGLLVTHEDVIACTFEIFFTVFLIMTGVALCQML